MIAACVRGDEIDIFVFLPVFLAEYNLSEDLLGHVHLVLLPLVYRETEIPALAVDGLLEDEWLARMGGHHSVYERNESLLNHLGIRV